MGKRKSLANSCRRSSTYTLLAPLASEQGLNPVHFGIIMVVNLAIGFVTPPVGVNLFVASGVAKVKLENVAKKVFPILGLMILLLLAIAVKVLADQADDEPGAAEG